MRTPTFLKIILFLLIITPVGIWGQDYSVTVDSGYVFIDGEFIEPPYTFVSKNFCIYVNNKQIRSPVYFSVYRKAKFYQINELHKNALESDLNLCKTFSKLDSTSINVILRRIRNLFRVFEEESAIKEVDTFINSLTYLKPIVYDDLAKLQHRYTIEDIYRNQFHFVILTSSKKSSLKYPQLLEVLKNELDITANSLRRGRANFFDKYGLFASIGPQAAKGIIIYLANESYSNIEKEELLKRICFLGGGWGKIIENCRPKTFKNLIERRKIDIEKVQKEINRLYH